MLDEFSEDVVFLSQPLLKGGTLTRLHEQYLQAFYEEEFDRPDDPLGSKQTRYQVPRAKIQATITGMPEHPVNPSDGQNLHRTIHRSMSGYVHGASGHIMEMYGGDPPRFHLRGMRGTPLMIAPTKQALDYHHRGLCTLMMATLALGQEELLRRLYAFRDEFEQQAGMTEWPDPKDLISRAKKPQPKSV